ncbi:pyocin S6 family toxin immunity protein [Pseudomonas sp. FEN]|uniref:pyocin S6 family toxin immunity protein n=1 Tax=Pseudomonas sp. FEN TaxID=2767468 RepID=UPI0017494A65|nr:pyocin S6 family toxin immunity protein [Pseudomonas sp. FEN]CAD5201055.1 hypothetical protein [Pseudomonas sp. FEN]
MYLCLTGFLPNNDEDDSLKFELCLDPSHNEKIVSLLGYKNLNAMAEGLWDLSDSQVREISALIGKELPTDLEMLIGVEA